ncbi:CU044_5270 family protein [Micromonospora sp. LOL_023]|uniref:CU044_5270 family protein n=1 Tax=Micromonospora sp. LOL_023 TaxID=3345418 RepID=UPI003A8A9EAA
MRASQRVEELLGPADPIQGMGLPSPRDTAHEIIERADHSSVQLDLKSGGDVRPSFVRRPRLALVAAVAIVVAAAAVTVPVWMLGDRTIGPATNDSLSTAAGAELEVLIPVAYRQPDNPPDAGPMLSDLADRIADAPYDNHDGTYSYHRRKSWGARQAMAPGGHIMSIAEETETWSDSSGNGMTKVQQLAPEFPTEESRRYWEGALDPSARTPGAPVSSTGLVGPDQPITEDPSELTRKLKVGAGAGTTVKAVNDIYSLYVVPRSVRSQILRVLAGTPSLHWRGEVVDRAGRTGVAVTTDDTEHNVQLLLIFDPVTGELLAHEVVKLTEPRQVQVYNLILSYGRTAEVG